jgi:hypothetical protein
VWNVSRKLEAVYLLLITSPAKLCRDVRALAI